MLAWSDTMTLTAGWVVYAAIFGFCAALLIGGGYLIRVHKKLHLLAGYDPAQVADTDGLARFAGAVCYCLGVVTLVIPFLMLFFPGTVAGALIAVLYMACTLAVLLWLVVGTRRFMK